MKSALCVELVFALTCGVMLSAQADLITGRVLSPEGKAVPHARVFVEANRELDAKWNTLRADEKGAFQIEMKTNGSNSFGRTLAVPATPDTTLAPGYRVLQRGENVLQLMRGHRIAGRVLDTNGQPVPGVRVRLEGAFQRTNYAADFKQFFWLRGSPLSDEYSALSDGQGRFSIGGVPDDANASLFLDDKRFVHVRRSFASEDAVVLNARPSAVLAGRVVDGASHGVAGVPVVARTQDPHASGVQEQTTTADDGSYEISGLPTDSYSIFTDARKQGLVAAALEWVSAREGQTREVPEIVLGVGAMVDVHARDEEGAPLAGISIGYGPNRLRFGSDARTDATGYVHLRVPEGQNSVSVDVAPEGLLIPRTGKTVEVKSLETVNLDFVLKRGLVLTGVVTDENGAPVKKLTLLLNPLTRAQSEYLFWNAYAITGDNGSWKAVGLLPGEYSLEISDRWEIVAPNRVMVTENPPSVAVKVRAEKLTTRRGRVISSDGRPVGGVRVEYLVQVPEGGTRYSMNPLPALSQANGEFALEGVRSDRKLVFSRASKKQWNYVQGGEVDEGTGELTAIVMAPLDRKILGSVVDEKGQPVAGAQVFATQASEVTVSDATGRFVLENLPPATLTLIAATAQANDTQSLDLQKADAENVRLTLHKASGEVPQDEMRAFDLLQQIWQESAGTEYYGRRNVALEMMRLDPERAQGIVGQLGELGLTGRIALLARANPDEALRWGVPRLGDVTDPQMNAYLAAQLGLAAAGRDPALAARMYLRARDGVAPVDGWGVMRLASLASLATLLKQPDAKKQLDAALEAARLFAQQNPDARGVLSAAVEDLAHFDTSNVEYALAQLGDKDKTDALRRAIPQVAWRDDPAALELLKQLKKMDEGDKFNYSGAAVSVVRSLGKRDAQAALALARSVTHSYFRAAALAAVAACQDEATAPALWREAAEAALNHQAPVAQLVEIAQKADLKFPALAHEFLLRAKSLLDEKAQGQFNRNAQDLPEFAFAYARYDPVYSRRVLEQEWEQRLTEMKTSTENSGWLLGNIVAAMAAVDFDRALEMARAIPAETANGKKDENARFEAQRKLAQYLTLFPVQRRTLKFGRWNVSDAWNAADE